MDDYPRQKLCEIISQYRHEVLDDTRRLEGLLRDYCSAYKKEVNVLVIALKERIPFELLKSNDNLPREVLFARLVSRLVEDLGLSEDVAVWAVETWALALKVIDKPGFLVKQPQHLIQDSQSDFILILALGVTLELVRVPAGEFLMGSDKKKDTLADNRDGPQHKVYLEEYLIGKYPVTNVQYLAFVNATGCRPPEDWFFHNSIPEGIEQHPVVKVYWEDAAAFCQWASQVTGRKVRLPSEAEWEKAARGTDGRIWPWGNKEPDETYCNFNREFGLHNPPGYMYKTPDGKYNQIWYTTPVGKYSPQGDSPYGCADMAGNVWEWTNSLLEYEFEDENGELIEAAEWTLKGGSFGSDRYGIRCAYHINRPRNFGPKNYSWTEFDYGFRVVVSPLLP
jgi:formylglycine-generating enzyme required for sulfatase activity